MSISARAIAMRRAKYKASQQQDTTPPKPVARDPWLSAGPPGSWGRPDLDQEPRKASDGWLERAHAALNNGSNSRFEMLARRMDRLMR